MCLYCFLMITSSLSRFKRFSTLGFGLFLCMTSAISYAGCDKGNGDGDCSANSSPVASTRSSAKAISTVGNPISVITGNKYQREVDYEASGAVASLVLNRFYNSLNTTTDTGMGFAWRHSFDVRLTSSADQQSMQINQSDGRRIIFKLDANAGLFRAVSPADGVITRSGKWPMWVLNDGRRILFNGIFATKIIYTGGRSFSLKYKGKGNYRKLSRVIDHQGRVLRFKYSSGSTALANFSQEASSDVDLAGHLESVTLPDGGVITYNYDTDHNLSKVIYPDATSRIYHYENIGFPNHLTGITDRTGKRFATWGYDDEGRANLSEHTDGVEKVTLEYKIPEQAGDVGTTVVTNSLGKKSTYEWKFYPRISQSLLLSSEGPGCSTCPAPDKRYTYNNHYQLETATDTKTHAVTHYAYDKQGRTQQINLSTQNDDGSTTKRLIARYEYEGDLPKPTLIARESVNTDGEHITEITYNKDQLPVALTEKGYSPNSDDDSFNAIERTTKLSYTNGNLTTIDGPRDDVEDLIELAYDQNNRLQSLTQANGQTLKVLAYDVNGHPTKIQKGTQSPLTITYNSSADSANSAQIKTITQRSKSIHYQYDPEGRLTQITTASSDGSSETIAMTYDEAGRLDTLNDDKGRKIQQIHDSESRPTTTKLMGSNGNVLTTISYLYDAQGRLDKTQTQNLDGDTETDYQYDDSGQLTQVEKNGQAVNLSYNNLGQLLGLTQPGEVVTQFSYDNKGQSTALTDARDNKTQTIKDDFGRVIQHISPDTGINTYAYDKAGNRVRREDPEGTVTTYQWDKANKLTQKLSTLSLSKGTELTTFSYDQATGKLASTTNPNTTESFKYNLEGQLTDHKREIDGHSFTTQYEYNEQDRLKKKHLPDGQTLRYHYYTTDDRFLSGAEGQTGKLRAITRESLFGLKQEAIISEIDNDKTDNQTSYLSHNGLKTNYEFRKDGQLKNIQIADTLKLQYSYDQNGNITGIDENGTLQNYGYDQGRLTFADMQKGQYWYSYDQLGNRTQKLHATKEGNILNDNYQYPEKTKGNRLTASSIDNMYELADQSKQYTYNQNGSPTTTDEFSYEYNSDQRPIKVYKTGDGNKQLLAEYAYNTFGERIKKTVYSDNHEPTTTYFLYDLQILSGKANQQGDVTVQYLYLQRKPVAKLEENATYAIHADHRDAPRMMTNDDKQTIWKAHYSPFGEINIEKQTAQLQLRLPGQYEDNETGTYYNYLRDYDPKTGRYITSDPLGASAGLNTYAYVKNDPMNRVDPLGLYDELIHYYMTYFLALVAGVPEDQAELIALATQFVDDNFTTSPFTGIPWGSLQTYHFTLDYNNGFDGDNGTTNLLTRFKNPASNQLSNLFNRSIDPNNSICQTTVRFGMFLHSFEDTFSDRDKNNKPFSLINIDQNNPSGWLGHLFAGHSPDHTYNQSTQKWTTRFDKPLPGGGFAQELTVSDKWSYNELRTLQMEKETYEKMKDFATRMGLSDTTDFFDWQDLSGDGSAKIGRPLDPNYTLASGTTGILQEFNSYNETTHPQGVEEGKKAKVKILNDWLENNGFNPISEYDKSKAKQETQQYF